MSRYLVMWSWSRAWASWPTWSTAPATSACSPAMPDGDPVSSTASSTATTGSSSPPRRPTCSARRRRNCGRRCWSARAASTPSSRGCRKTHLRTDRPRGFGYPFPGTTRVAHGSERRVLDLRPAAADDTTVVDVAGEVDMGTGPAFQRGLLRAIGASRGGLIVDLSHATFHDSSALTSLVNAFDHLRHCGGGTLAIVASDPRMRALFEVARLERDFLI